MTGSITKNTGPNSIAVRVNWTPDGVEKMKTLHALLHKELGYGTGYRGGVP